VTVDLSGVTNIQTISVTLGSVTDGTTTNDVTVRMSVLAGDTNGNRSVTASDIGETKARSGQAVTAVNFRADVNASGSINASDISVVKSRSGTQLP